MWNYLLLILAIVISYYVYKYRSLISVLIEYLQKLRNPETTVIFNENHVHVTYYVNKIPHKMRIPHHPKNKLKFHTMILIKESSEGTVEEVDITHRHGIPYFLSARELGGSYIVKRIAEEEIARFELNEIPKI